MLISHVFLLVFFFFKKAFLPVFFGGGGEVLVGQIRHTEGSMCFPSSKKALFFTISNNNITTGAPIQDCQLCLL